MRLIAITCALLALAACHKPAQPAAKRTAPAAEAAPAKGVDRSHKGRPEPALTFADADGAATNLAAFRGQPLLVNLWATWCAPCVKELPTLDKLSRSNTTVKIVAISQDVGPHASVVAFLQGNRIAGLDAYQDSKLGLSTALDAPVLPTTILFDADGREIWRYVGDFDWTSPEAAKLLSEAATAPKPS